MNDDEYAGYRSKIFTGIAIAALVLTVVGGILLFPSSGSDDISTITLYGFSVKGEVFDESIIPAFKEYWENRTGEKVDFRTNYAGSGKITNQVISGAPAEVMILSTEWDAVQLERDDLVTTNWRSYPYGGTVSKSPWVIITREGNPRSITDFRDLVENDVEIVHADPLTSGGACWSIFSVYGSELRRTEVSEGSRNGTAAEELLRGMTDNVISWQSSARKALSQFMLGYGDAFITYENDALLARSRGEPIEIVYPSSTIYSEHKAVIVDEHVSGSERELIEGFVDFLYSTEAQKIFVEYGFRSVHDNLNADFREIEDPFTIDYLGGWEDARAEIIEGVFTDIRE